MFICEYCGRYLKKKYDNCPACGGKSFKRIQSIGEKIIKDPPKDGYKVNVSNFKHERKFSLPGIIITVFVIVMGLGIIIPFISFGFADDEELSWFKYIFMAFGIIFLFSLIKVVVEIMRPTNKMIAKSNSSIKNVKQLAKKGMLIKNLKYEIKPVDKMINGNKTVYYIQVIYEIEKGKTKCFKSEPKYLTALGRDDGTVDLLIDPNDYDNYFIDFEIY